jgi:hypothetical protein
MRVRWAGHVANEQHTKLTLNGRSSFGHCRTKAHVIFIRISKIRGGGGGCGYCLDSAGSVNGPVTICTEYGNDIYLSITGEKFVNQLSKY